MPVYDRLLDYEDKLKHILARHEQGAAHAAQAYAMVTGKTGVLFCHFGPGATNLITGIANAYLDSVPCLYNCPGGSNLIGTDAFQETDILGVSMPVVKMECTVKKSEDIPAIIAKASILPQPDVPGSYL